MARALDSHIAQAPEPEPHRATLLKALRQAAADAERHGAVCCAVMLDPVADAGMPASRLKSLIDSLVSSGFVTERASGKFQQSYEQWNSGAKNVVAGLEGMSSFLNTAIAQHQQLDQQLSQSTGG